jgi:hypothetical protein
LKRQLLAKSGHKGIFFKLRLVNDPFTMDQCGSGESIMEWQPLDEELVLGFSVGPDLKYFFIN